MNAACCNELPGVEKPDLCIWEFWHLSNDQLIQPNFLWMRLFIGLSLQVGKPIKMVELIILADFWLVNIIPSPTSEAYFMGHHRTKSQP